MKEPHATQSRKMHLSKSVHVLTRLKTQFNLQFKIYAPEMTELCLCAVRFQFFFGWLLSRLLIECLCLRQIIIFCIFFPFTSRCSTIRQMGKKIFARHQLLCDVAGNVSAV